MRTASALLERGISIERIEDVLVYIGALALDECSRGNMRLLCYDEQCGTWVDEVTGDICDVDKRGVLTWS